MRLDKRAYERGYKYYKYNFDPAYKKIRQWESIVFYWKKKSEQDLLTKIEHLCVVHKQLYPNNWEKVITLCNKVFK